MYILVAIHHSLRHWYLLFHITSGSRKILVLFIAFMEILIALRNTLYQTSIRFQFHWCVNRKHSLVLARVCVLGADQNKSGLWGRRN